MIAATLFTILSTSFAPRAFAEQRFAQPPTQVAHRDLARADVAPVIMDRAAVRAALVTNRAAFRAYQRTGVFPSNTHGDRALNVWRDREGHFCAAATIIRVSGGVALADKIAEQNNFIKLGEVTRGPVMDWILASGFTQDEIAAIQEPFMPVAREPRQPKPIIAADLRKAETQRLVQKYRAVEQMLVTNQEASLDIAVDRLMKHRELAAAVITAPTAS
ncbi:MAG: hypothetical protein H0T79_04530 [Deltaproteobacteria bacterium]|nr:hypothetical protein [Deltaproteobacteria bacterium]